MKNVDLTMAISAAVGMAIFGGFIFVLSKAASSVPAIGPIVKNVKDVVTGEA